MAEYIEREALMVSLCKEIVGDGDYYNGKDDMQDQIRDMVSRFPAADVAPVRHGWWKRYGKNLGECSECGEIVSVRSNYCPHCGATMNLEV